jgi:hypothetical protein
MFRYIIFFLLSFASCTGNSQQVETSKEFINNITVDDSVYTKDSATIVAALYSKLQNHESSFYNKEYFDSTKLIIDKILYDSTKNKIAVFVLVENPMSRRKYPDLNYKVYYSSYCYLGKRTEADNFELKWFNTFYPINFNNKQEISDAIEQLYFTELATIVDGDDKPVYKYNLNDKRFWAGPGWKKFFD